MELKNTWYILPASNAVLSIHAMFVFKRRALAWHQYNITQEYRV